ncbi:MAG: MFS transporter, partial [Verrucomicrobiales bacterium]|nr:MFS transporter [Verrucomicrobiales bacterium]
MSHKAVIFGTVSFTICFAAWGLISAFAPTFRETFGLSATQTAFLISIPVLLGSLARLPMGMLSDRMGGRGVFAALMLAVAVPVFLIPTASTYQSLLVLALLLGMAGSSFAVGISYVSRWTSAESQGRVLGIYGVGNIGQSAAVFLGPLIARQAGWPAVFQGTALLLTVWGLVFAFSARNAPMRGNPVGFLEAAAVLRRSGLPWVLSSFYFLTFGGFVAFSIYLPTLLRDEFELTATDAGFRAAGFVVLATLMRPIGGWLSDHIGGARVLAGVFLGIAPFALLLAWAETLPFTVGALGCAALLGTGNGAVFKLVPQYFPRETGTVTGLVGAFGGMGGFFPPLALGFFRDQFEVIWPGFALLAAVSLVLWRVNARVFLSRQESWEFEMPAAWSRTAEQIRAGSWATMWTGLLCAAIVVGSRNLQNFDPALVVYTFAVVFATWGVAYHYYVWLQKPPTQLFWRRGWELFRRRGRPRTLARLLTLAGSGLLAQTFIRRRSVLRWWMHQFLFWGCLLAAAITFPLVFGWIHFGSAPDDQMTYVTYLFGFPVASFRIRTAVSWLLFHGLDIAAVLVLAGISLALWRRMRERGALALQSFARDLLPLAMLFAISVTGLALTASTLWLRGIFYDFLALFHTVTVVAALLYLPFGKFFHIFQRPAQLGVKLYVEEGESGAAAHCARCGERFASRMHVDDLKQTLSQLGFDYRLEKSGGNWQDVCPPCKRKSLALTQLQMMKEA